MQKILNKVQQYLTYLFVFLLPIIILPFFTDPFDFGRQIFVLVFCTILFILWFVNSVISKKFVIYKNKYFFPVILLLIVSLLSTVLNAPNKIPSFMAINGAINIFLCLTIIFLVSSLNNVMAFFFLLLASGAVLSVSSIILNVGKFSFPLKIPLLNINLDKGFSLTGSQLAQLLSLLIIAPLGFAVVYEQVRQNKIVRAGLAAFLNVLVLGGVGLSIYMLNNFAKPVLLPQATAWAVAVETIKNSKLAILGISPGSFINAFTAFKPFSYNNTPFWNIRFNTSSNWYYQLLTEIGILGLLFYINLVWKILKNAFSAIRKQKISAINLAVYVSLIIFVVAQLFMPMSLGLIFLFAVLLALTQSGEPVSAQATADGEKWDININAMGNAAIVFIIFPIILFGGLLFYCGRVTLANVYFLNSIKAANANDGVKTYNLQFKAFNTDKTNPTYRIAYSQTNLALANSLATKKDLTDQDRSTITQLVQQSIREAKSAVTLDPNYIIAWENLSNTYRQLINFAQGADEWTISAYQEAMKYDPLNPALRLDLGGVYYSLQKLNEAATYFLQATNLKSDYANAHYNLANVFKTAGAYADAKREYEITLSLVAIDSADYTKVGAELVEVKKKLPPEKPATAVEPETLSTPQKPSTGIKPPVEVPEGEPPVTTGTEEASPTVQPEQ